MQILQQRGSLQMETSPGLSFIMLNNMREAPNLVIINL